MEVQIQQNTEVKVNFDELIQMSLEARELKTKERNERFMNGRKEAIKFITQECYEKMKSAALKGDDKAIIYSCSWVKNPDDTHDENGNQTVFDGNVRILDLLNKGRDDFFKDLTSFFNTDGENKYHCGFYKKLDSWYIFVSWGPPPSPQRREYGFNKKQIFEESNITDQPSTWDRGQQISQIVKYGGGGGGHGHGRGRGRGRGREFGRGRGRGEGIIRSSTL